MERMASWMEEALRQRNGPDQQLDQELERRGRDATEEPALPGARPDGPVAGLSSVSPTLKRRRSRFQHTDLPPGFASFESTMSGCEAWSSRHDGG